MSDLSPEEREPGDLRINPPALLFFLPSVPCQHLPLAEPNHKPEGWGASKLQYPRTQYRPQISVEGSTEVTCTVAEWWRASPVFYSATIIRSRGQTNILYSKKALKNCLPYRELSNQGANIFLICNGFVILITQVEFLLLWRNENITDKTTYSNDYPFSSHALPTDTSLLINVGHMYASLFIHLDIPHIAPKEIYNTSV